MKKPRILLILLFIIISAILIINFSSPQYTFYGENTAYLKVAFQHAGERISEFDERAFLKKQAEAYRASIRAEKGAKMNLDMSGKNYTRERYPVSVKLIIDNKMIFDKKYLPAGSKRDTDSIIYENIEVSAGYHEIEIEMKDSLKDNKAPYILKDRVEFKNAEIKVIDFNRGLKALYWSARHKQADVRHSAD